jgi:uncharacterized paraquat-inducible protein A
MSQLKCESCGLIYSLGAIAREMALATGVDCRRCGGTLAEGSDAPQPPPDAIMAVHSTVTGHERLPFA